MQNAGLDDSQAGIKIPGENINNLRYADDSTLMAESEEELKSLLIRVKAAAAAAAKSFQLSLTLCDPIDSSPPGSPSLGFSRQEHWSGLPFPSPMQESEK